MCGIFSLFFSEQVTNKKKYEMFLDNAMKVLEKRGPDSCCKVVSERYLCGFQRLTINDLTELGNQPMESDDEKIFLMCNGEIFNFLELKDKYNLKMKSHSDCEVILRMYENNCLNVEELNGDFAFVIYDQKRNLITLGRDRMGVRPLFYGFTEDHSFAVSSEVKALSCCANERIFHVQPGTVVKYDLNKEDVSVNPYYFHSTIQKDIEPTTAKLRSMLFSSTQKRLLSERPIGCLLSGGLDSSIICAILCELVGSRNVRTYSIGMEGSLDLQYARKVANFLGTTHHEVLFTPKEGLDAIPEVIYHLESYDITTVRASVGMYLLGKYISNNTQDKVIFSGEGSDELFCGYLYFHYAPTPEDAHVESLRLMSDMYKYDVLRADRCISSNGLELRVPFLDPEVIEYAKALSPELKAPNGQIEKRVLREAFRYMLPEEVLYRRKDGFSDGVSSTTKSWYEYIKEHVGDSKTSTKKEAEWYRKIYDKHYPFYSRPIDYFWMPKWVNAGDNPSGRVLTIFQK